MNSLKIKTKLTFTQNITNRYDYFQKDLVSIYKELDNVNESDLIFSIEDSMEYFSINQAIIEKNKKIVSIEILDIDNFDNIITSDRFSKDNKRETEDCIGIFKLTFKGGKFILIYKWFSGEGKLNYLESLICGTEESIKLFRDFKNKNTKDLSKPKKGIFRASTDAMGNLNYTKIIDLKETPIIHPSFKILKDDLDAFFKDLTPYLRYNQSGVRKSLLIGPPGTGKTSIVSYIANLLKNKFSIVFVTDIQSCSAHTNLCAKYKVPTIVLFEDCESSFDPMNNGRGHNTILNYLDGVDQRRNESGAYIIMTTNHPDKIEPRILQRPGRIDKIIGVGAIINQDAKECARVYFKDILFKDTDGEELIEKKLNELQSILNNSGKGMVGSEIKAIAESCIGYAISNGIEEIDVNVVKQVFEKITNDMKDVYSLAENAGLLNNKKSISFMTHEELKPINNNGFLTNIGF